jgi:hypothetical protein
MLAWTFYQVRHRRFRPPGMKLGAPPTARSVFCALGGFARTHVSYRERPLLTALHGPQYFRKCSGLGISGDVQDSAVPVTRVFRFTVAVKAPWRQWRPQPLDSCGLESSMMREESEPASCRHPVTASRLPDPDFAGSQHWISKESFVKPYLPLLQRSMRSDHETRHSAREIRNRPSPR